MATTPNATEREPRVIVALDYDNAGDALAFADAVHPSDCRLKVGLELFTLAGPSLVEKLTSRGFDIFLDLKFHDIPNTVAGAVRSACRLGVDMLTVHASGGAAMLKAASEEALSSASPPLVLAVTALTSLSEEDMRRYGVHRSMEEWVERLARTACEAGIRGLVASAGELPMLRSKMDPDLQLVIPGIRPAGSAAQDQSRTATPGEAIKAGASYLVIGRPIMQAPDPAKAADAVIEDIAHAL